MLCTIHSCQTQCSWDYPKNNSVAYLLPNSRFPKLPSPALDWIIWKALYLCGCLFGCLFGCLVGFCDTFDSFDVTLALKVVSFNFYNELDWTGPY
jgi:hypothetical protein